MTIRMGLSAALLTVVLQGQPVAAGDAALVRPSEADATVGISDLEVGATSMSGNVNNKSSATLKEVHLVLRQEFRWKNEKNPGAESPGRALPFKIETRIAPNSSAPFKFHFDPLPARTDGTFTSSLEVTGFTKLEP